MQGISENKSKLVLDSYSQTFALILFQNSRLANIFLLIAFSAIAFDIKHLPEIHANLWDAIWITIVPAVSVIALVISYILCNKMNSRYIEMLWWMIDSDEYDLLNKLKPFGANYTTIISILNCILFAGTAIARCQSSLFYA